MAVEMTNNGILSLDFWQDTVIYQGQSFPTGTLGCNSLNIPAAMVKRLEGLCIALNQAMGAASTGELNAALLDAARDSALQIVDMLQSVPPFSYLDANRCREQIERTVAPEQMNGINEYAAALISGEAAFLESRYKDAILFFRILPVMAQLGFSLREYQKTLFQFAGGLDKQDCQRTPEGYAAAFGSFFPPAPSLTDGGAWMALTNSTVQYASAQRPGQAEVMLVKRMHFVSFVGMFRSDLFEGLCVGHGPKKCPICGRWFLTMDARRTKYCGGLAPGDARGRSCRQIGNLKGREQRELAADHPLKVIYERRMNTIGRLVLRGSLPPELADRMKRLAKDKLLRAISDNAYARMDYAREMTQEALLAEAGRK